jgi:tetratricopeptide (TPR) repeat protein
MVNLDELEDLLRRGEKEKAYKLIKEDRGISAEILMNEAITFGTIEEHSLSISYLELAEKIAEDNEIKGEAREKLAATYYNRGLAYNKSKQHEKAIEDYNKAIELDPKEAGFYFNRGSIYLKLNRYKKAIEDFDRAIKLNPNSTEAYLNRGAAYQYLSQYEKAIEDFTKVIERDPKLDKAYNNRGIANHNLKQYEEAIKDFSKAIELNPNDTIAYSNRANVYRDLKQYNKAIRDCNKAIKIDPKYAGAYSNRGLTYHDLKQYKKALEDYNRAIELNLKWDGVYYNRGLTYHESNRYEEAIRDFNKAIELNPNDALEYYSRGLSYLNLNRYEEAIDDFDKAIELNPEDTEAYLNRGVAHYYLSQYEEAIEDLNKAIELNPKDARAYSNRGSVYINLRRNEEAIENYNKAIALNQNFAAAYANRGVTLVQTNEDLDNAIEDFKRARDLFEWEDKERMLGIIEWAKARKEMNMKNWSDFRERMNEAREIFEKINDPLSLSFAASIKFSYLDEELDNALNIPDPIKALEEIETALKNPPKVEGLINPERTIFGARIASFAILSEFISSVRGIDENTDLRMVKAKLAELLEDSGEVEDAFESVDFVKGKTTIVDIQDIMSSVKQEIEEIKWAANKKQKALEILIEYWSRLSSAIKVMNGISTRETENIALRKEIREVKSEVRGGRAETREIISKGFEKSSEEHKEILEKIYVTENILMQKDAINARYRIEFPPPPSPAKIIIDIPIGKLTEKQIEEKAEEIVRKIKSLRGNVKEAFLEAIKHIPVIGNKLLKRLKKMKG